MKNRAVARAHGADRCRRDKPFASETKTVVRWLLATLDTRLIDHLQRCLHRGRAIVGVRDTFASARPATSDQLARQDLHGYIIRQAQERAVRNAVQLIANAPGQFPRADGRAGSSRWRNCHRDTRAHPRPVSTAPRPSTMTSGECAGSFHSRICVKGCQTWERSMIAGSHFVGAILSNGAAERMNDSYFHGLPLRLWFAISRRMRWALPVFAVLFLLTRCGGVIRL